MRFILDDRGDNHHHKEKEALEVLLKATSIGSWQPRSSLSFCFNPVSVMQDLDLST